MKYARNSLTIYFLASYTTVIQTRYDKRNIFNTLSLIPYKLSKYLFLLVDSCKYLLSLFVPGEPGSHVFGSISDGVFHGKIISPRGGAWYVEKAYYYFPPHEINDTLHSVIYHENNVDDPYAHLRKGKIESSRSFLSLFFLPLRVQFQCK